MNAPARPIVYTDTDIPARRKRDMVLLACAIAFIAAIVGWDVVGQAAPEARQVEEIGR